MSCDESNRGGIEPPRRLWLQWHGDQEPELMDDKPEDVTWCEDQIFHHDIEYWRADQLRDENTVWMMILRGEIALSPEKAAHIAGQFREPNSPIEPTKGSDNTTSGT